MTIKRKGQRKVSPMFEVFKPKDGKAFYRTRYVRLAKVVAWAFNADYEKTGSGWVKTPPSYNPVVMCDNKKKK